VIIVEYNGEAKYMWRHVAAATEGVLWGLNDVLTRLSQQQPHLFPDFFPYPAIFVASDYSGQHQTAHYEAYSFVMTNRQWWGSWEHARLKVRSKFLLMRRFSFKALDDAKRWEALPAFLDAAAQMQGVSVTILVNKRFRTLFSTSGRLNLKRKELARIAQYKEHTAEKFVRITHFLGLLIAGFSHPHQEVLWFTDQDDIAANDKRLQELATSMAEICSQIVPHPLREIRCGTTAADNGALQIEDLAALADFSAGALVEIMDDLESRGLTTSERIGISSSNDISLKTIRLMRWLTQADAPHKHIVIAVDPGPTLDRIEMRRMVFEAVRRLP
jgi:hypothetical protein